MLSVSFGPATLFTDLFKRHYRHAFATGGKAQDMDVSTSKDFYSEEQYEELMMNHWNSFLLKKFVFNLFIIVLLLVFMAVLNKLLKNEKIKSTLFYALILFVLTSIITIYASTKCF